MSPSPNSTRTQGPSDLQAIKECLREALPRLRDKYAVESLALHGSWVRGEAGPNSDLDMLVEFENSEAGRQVSLLDFIGLKQELEDLLDVPVDLGEHSALEGAVGEKIRRDAEFI